MWDVNGENEVIFDSFNTVVARPVNVTEAMEEDGDENKVYEELKRNPLECSSTIECTVVSNGNYGSPATYQEVAQTAMQDKSNQSEVPSEVEAGDFCKICGDITSGRHYGVLTCEGCKNFFKRSIQREVNYVCKNNGKCVVNVQNRNKCQFCRYQKCTRAGMHRPVLDTAKRRKNEKAEAC